MGTSSTMSLINVFIEPKSVFDNLHANKKWGLVGLALLIGITALSSMMFFNGMSTDWLIEQQLAGMGDVSPSEMKNARQGLAMMVEHTGTMAAVGSLIMFPMTTALFALYYKVASSALAVTKPDFTFADWFSFSIWTQMPALINTLGFMALFLTAATSDLPISMPNYASINQLLLGYVAGESLYVWAESLNLFSIWSAVIATIGFNRCCKMPFGQSAFCAVLPLVIIFGVWFLLA
jgi:hypothetical protein